MRSTQCSLLILALSILALAAAVLLSSCRSTPVSMPGDLDELLKREIIGAQESNNQTLVDDLSPSAVASWKDVRENPKDWPIVYDLTVKLGSKFVMTTPAATAWPDGGGDVNGNLHFIVMRDGAWRAFCWDYTRPGQTTKGFPWYPPKDG